MNVPSMKAFSTLPIGMILALGCAALSTPGQTAAGMSVGTCVTVNHRPGPAKIIAVTQGGYVVQPEGKAASEALNWAQSDVMPGPCPSAAATAALAAEPHICFASDPDSKGATALERNFRSLIRRTFEREAAQGSDGAVTISFQSLKVSAPRRWLVSDGYNFSSDQSKPIYDLRVQFTTCTDYRSAIDIRQEDQNFECFTAPTGGASCQLSGSTHSLSSVAHKYIPKQ